MSEHTPSTPDQPLPSPVRGTSSLLFLALGLFIAAGLAGGLDASGRLQDWQVAGDIALVLQLGPVCLVASIAVAAAALLRHAFVSLRARARTYPEGTLNKGAHVVASIALLTLLVLVILGVIWWSSLGAFA